jgi:hypothetical protein
MLVLSDTIETPNSPLGDSTALYVQPDLTGKPSLQYLK